MPDSDGRDDQPVEGSAGEPPASARSPEDGETQVLDPVEDHPAQVMGSVNWDEDEPEPRRTPWAPSPSDPPTSAGDDADDASGHRDPAVTPSAERNWMGVAAFLSGALFLSVIAIILGHLGVSAAKRGRANNRGFSIAGLILGYLGLVLTAVGAWLYVSDPSAGADLDARAQQDVSAVGAAAAADASLTGRLPEVEQVDNGYRVGDETIAANLPGEPRLSFTGSAATDWCLSIGYDGGEESAFHYVATSGMAPGPCPGGD